MYSGAAPFFHERRITMLTKREAERIDRYFETHYNPTEVDIDYLNEVADFIVECIDPGYCQQNADKLLKTAEDVHRKMSAIFILENCSPRLLYYQEVYYQLMTLYAKATGKDDTQPLAMLCFTSSFDLFWLQRIKTEG